MWIIFLEAGVALLLLLCIVWATLPRKPRTPALPPAQEKPARDDSTGA